VFSFAGIRTLRLENEVREGRLVPRRSVEIWYSTRVVQARTRLLGLPSRAKQRIPHLTAADVQELDALVREVLEELADDRTEPTP
jgi:phage terminase Nu1 subunit (DNA packaging protein)